MLQDSDAQCFMRRRRAYVCISQHQWPKSLKVGNAAYLQVAGTIGLSICVLKSRASTEGERSTDDRGVYTWVC